MAAYSAGAKTVLIPMDNNRDLEDIDPLARENLQFIPCKTASEVLTHALLSKKQESKTDTKDTDTTSQYIPIHTAMPSSSVRFSENNN